MEEHRDRKTDVLAISVDDVPSHRAWMRELSGLSFPLLSDAAREVSLSLRVLNEADGRASYGVS